MRGNVKLVTFRITMGEPAAPSLPPAPSPLASWSVELMTEESPPLPSSLPPRPPHPPPRHSHISRTCTTFHARLVTPRPGASPPRTATPARGKHCQPGKNSFLLCLAVSTREHGRGAPRNGQRRARAAPPLRLTAGKNWRCPTLSSPKHL